MKSSQGSRYFNFGLFFRISKRKIKLADSDKKRVNRDLKNLQNSSSSHFNYESENFNDQVMDPAASNAKMAAEFGIEYPPDFENESKEKNQLKFNSIRLEINLP